MADIVAVSSVYERPTIFHIQFQDALVGLYLHRLRMMLDFQIEIFSEYSVQFFRLFFILRIFHDAADTCGGADEIARIKV